MSTDSQTPPNTHLGEVIWWRCMHYGRLLFVCQGLLGLTDGKRGDFLDHTKFSVGDLRDFFDEERADDGTLSLILFADNLWRTTALATIRTAIPYNDEVEVPDQVFLNLIADFIEYVRTLPLEEAGEDPYTEEELADAHAYAEGFWTPIFEGTRAEGAVEAKYFEEIPGDLGALEPHIWFDIEIIF